MNSIQKLGVFLEGRIWKDHFEKIPVSGVYTCKSWTERARLVRERLRAEFSHRPVFISLTHTYTPTQGAFWVLACDRPVGIDIELVSRKLSSQAASRLLRSEKKWDLEPLAFWVIKEAAFKANPLNEGTVLSQYRVISWNAATSQGRVQFQEGLGEFQLLVGGDCWMACVLWK